MKISIDKSAGVSGVITIELVRADYEEKVKDSLKSFCKRAQLPGFRPGKLPMGMAKRMYGSQAKLEVVNKMLSDSCLDTSVMRKSISSENLLRMLNKNLRT